ESDSSTAQIPEQTSPIVLDSSEPTALVVDAAAPAPIASAAPEPEWEQATDQNDDPALAPEHAALREHLGDDKFFALIAPEIRAQAAAQTALSEAPAIEGEEHAHEHDEIMTSVDENFVPPVEEPWAEEHFEGDLSSS